MSSSFRIVKGVPPRARLHVYPDVQNETQFQLYFLDRQISYTIDRAPDLVLFMGDLTNLNTSAEWLRFQSQIARLNTAGLKWLVVPGNHDTDVNRNTLINNYLTPGAWMTGAMVPGQIENTYTVISIGGVTWLILCLEYGPRDATVTWANSVLDAYPSLPAIIVTHCYLYGDGTRYDWDVYGTSQTGNPHDPNGYLYTPAQGTNDGQDLWDKIVSTRSNVRLVLCGHNWLPPLGIAQNHRVDTRLGTNCLQLLQDYQQDNAGYGSGILIEIDLDLDNHKLISRTFNTVNNSPIIKSTSDFYLDLQV